MDETTTPEEELPDDMAKEFTTDHPSIEEIMRKKKPVRKWVDIPLDSEVTDALSLLETEIENAEKELNRERLRAQTQVLGKSLAEGSRVSELVKKIEDLEAEYDRRWDDAADTIVRFTFQDIGKKRYDDLVSEHPPTDEQKKGWEDEGGEGKLAYNVETFPPALLSIASFEPKISLDYANKIFDDWGNWEVIRLFNTAQAACSGVASVPKSRRSLTDTDETPISD